MSPAQVLRDAAALLERDGWTTRPDVDAWGAAAAIVQAAVRGKATHVAAGEGIRAMQEVVGMGVSVWERIPHHTAKEVTTAMRAAADALDGGQA